MNNNPQMNKARLDMLLSMAGKKLGTDPSKLKSQLEQGAFDAALKGINQDQAAQINRLLSNPQALEQLLNTPRAKQLLNELMGGK